MFCSENIVIGCDFIAIQGISVLGFRMLLRMASRYLRDIVPVQNISTYRPALFSSVAYTIAVVESFSVQLLCPDYELEDCI